MDKHIKRLRKANSKKIYSQFDRRVQNQAERLSEFYQQQVFDSKNFTVGLELECYAVNESRIEVINDDLLADAPFNPELGLQNAEINSSWNGK